jgi:hypothetical protein
MGSQVADKLRVIAGDFNNGMVPTPGKAKANAALLSNAADTIEELFGRSCSRCGNGGAYHDAGKVTACPDCAAGHYLQGREEAREGEDEFKARAERAEEALAKIQHEAVDAPHCREIARLYSSPQQETSR